MHDIGVGVEQDDGTYTISNPKITKQTLEPHLHQRIRSSVLLVGPMLHQGGEVSFPSSWWLRDRSKTD
jgi:UDP-N-acetylglucosamine enolpyruvyl transferase